MNEPFTDLPGIFAARVGKNGAIHESSPAWLELFGPDEHIANLIQHPRWQSWPEGVVRATATDKDGTTVSLLAVKDEDLLVAVTDAQDAQSASKMASLLDELDNLRRRANEQKERIRRSNEDLQALAYGLSHDLGSHIRRALTVSTPHSPANIHLNRAQELLARLARFGKAGTMEIDESTFDLGDLLTDLEDDLPDIELIQENISTVRGDRDLLNQVFENLLGNSAKYCDPPVKVWVTQEDGRIVVDDNGPGVNEFQAESMFNMFQRHSTRPGTGIGLALCRKVLENHGGTIHAVVKPDGCRIVLEWPGARATG